MAQRKLHSDKSKVFVNILDCRVKLKLWSVFRVCRGSRLPTRTVMTQYPISGVKRVALNKQQHPCGAATYYFYPKLKTSISLSVKLNTTSWSPLILHSERRGGFHPWVCCFLFLFFLEGREDYFHFNSIHWSHSQRTCLCGTVKQTFI